jgi:predicted ABC-type transport system involved in lysophospholipase L1 biosynthesis, permease component
MLAKLAFRNVRRQIGNYLIYFITVSMTVALIFAVNNIIFSEQLMAYAENMSELRGGMLLITIFIALIVSFVLGYATSFMLKLRKREFGNYLTLGMTRANILFIFVFETLILGAAALIAGVLIGLLIYQGLMLLIVNIMQLEFSFATYSKEGLLLTVIMVAAIFVLSSLTSAVYLKRVSIYKLLNGDKISEKGVKHPVFWFITAIISFIMIVVACVFFYISIDLTMEDRYNFAVSMMMLSLLAIAVFLVLFHIAFARGFVNVLLKNKRLCSNGANIFTLRQLSSRLGSNSVMAGALAFLIGFAVIGANCSFIQKISNDASLEKRYLYDIVGCLETEEHGPISIADAESIISSYTNIKNKVMLNIYENGQSTVYDNTKFSGEGYDGLTDFYIRESDLNAYLKGAGKDPYDLNGGYMILAMIPHVMFEDFSNFTLELNGKKYPYRGMTDTVDIGYGYMLVAVPDGAVEGMEVANQNVFFNVEDNNFDAKQLRKDLSYIYNDPDNLYSFEATDFSIKEYTRINTNSATAIFVIGALYIAVIFIFLAMAILALKTLSGISDDRRRYDILFKLGAESRECSRSLFRQIFSFFALPFVLPMLLSIPAGIVCSHIMIVNGFGNEVLTVVLMALFVAIVITAAYLIYFTATYLIAKRNVIRN